MVTPAEVRFRKAKKEHVAVSGIHGWEFAPKFPHKLLDFLVRFVSRQNELNNKTRIVMPHPMGHPVWIPGQARNDRPLSVRVPSAARRIENGPGDGMVTNPPSCHMCGNPPPFG